MNSYYRKRGVKIGERCLICSKLLVSEPFLIEIGDDVVVSTGVEFVTHDHSIMKLIPNGANLFGKIIIGNNCFIGERSILMYGVKLADNIIVASGSVVTKSFSEERIIIGGNPARIIGTWDEFKKKSEGKAVSAHGIRELIKVKPEILVERSYYQQK